MEVTIGVHGTSGSEVVVASRALVRAVLEAWNCTDPDETGALVSSEIVTNAVRHGTGVLAVHLDLSLVEGTARFAVEDPNPSLPVAREEDLSALDGRGLFLVEALANRWGSVATDRGKVVWCEFPVHLRERRAPN